MTDEQILDLYWQRDEHAIRETDSKYAAYCSAIANRILNNREDVEECVSDTWLQAWNAIPPRRPNNFKLFLAKITRNLAFNAYKAKTTQKRGGGEIPLVLEELAECIAAPSDTESAFFAEELTQCLNRFVRSLPAREADLFVRRYFFTEAVSDIAARFGLSANHVSTLLHRTRQKLQTYLQQEGYLI